MKRIALGVLLLLSARAALAEAEPAKKKARPPAPRTASERWAPPAASAEPSGSGSQTKWAAPELPPPDATEALVGMPAGASPPTGANVEAASKGAKSEAPPRASAKLPSAKATAPKAAPADTAPRSLLASMRALSLAEGEARVVLTEGERVLRPGDRLGADTVRTVSEGVIVLDRPAASAQPGGAATVLVRFDASGQARVRVFYEQDPTPLPAPRMK